MKYIQTQWLQIIIVLVSCGLAFGCGAVSAAETLVIAGWSGDYEKQLRQVGLITAFYRFIGREQTAPLATIA